MIPDVVVYFSSLQKQTPSRKIDVLQSFADGAHSQGARVIIQRTTDIIPGRMAVILGWPSPMQHGANIRLRSAVVKQQKRDSNHVMAIDASTFKFHDREGKYLRYSLNGVFYDTSEYANRNSDSSRWLTISNNLGLVMRPWRTQGEYVLLLMQRDGGWSMKGLDPIQWVRQKHQQLRQVSNIPIVVRPHPGKKIDLSSLKDLEIQISDSRTRTLQQDLSEARAACVFNSSSGVAAILEGVPLMVDDRSAVTHAVSHHGVDVITAPRFPDRQQWIWDLAAAHWSDEESRQGLIWNKFQPYIS
jgi:hypothetical protein